MPTLLLDKVAHSGTKTAGGQLRGALPKLRLPVQSAAAATLAPTRHRAGRGWTRRSSPVGPGGVARLIRRDAGPSLPAHSDAAGPAMDANAAASALSPVAFARQVLGVSLWHKQEEVLDALTSSRRVAVKAGNGLGKGFSAAVAVLWFMHTHPDGAIALTTAPTFRQVRHILWRQIHRLYRPVVGVLGGAMYDTRWEMDADRYALGLSADGADQFQGFHSPNVFIVVDEAEGVSDEIYEAIESVMTSADPLLLLIGNPTSMEGAFRRAFHEERSIYRTITISAMDSPNVRAGRVVLPGLTTAAWVEERKTIWGEGSPRYRSRVLGEFPEQGEDTLIDLRHIRNSVNRRLPSDNDSGEVVLGVDVARQGSDRSVILRRRGNRVEDIQTFRKLDTMELAGRVADEIREHHPARVQVDEIGWGAGVVDRLRELGHPVHGVNVARAANYRHKYANLRSEGYCTLADRFSQEIISIPDDQELIGELAAISHSEDNLGRRKIERKADMRSKGLPSPDKADALMLAFLDVGGKVRVWT